MEGTIQKTAHVLAQLAPTGQGPTKSFQILVRSIGEAKTKHEEDRIIRREGMLLKDKMAARDTNPRQMREYLIRMIYCEMLGISCPWGHIHAVTFTQKNSIVDKRIGYLTCSLVLHPEHELNMLLVNSIQRDLKSSNMLEVSMALIIICRLIGAEMIPAVLPLVRDKLLHPKELVRKKAILALHHFYRCSPSSIEHLMDDIRKGLSDSDPGVMEAALILLHDIIQDNPLQHKDLTSAFTSILSQVVGHRLPREFEYHGVPAPWVQMRLLRILAILGADDSKTSELIYPEMEGTLACAESNSNVGQAITYECIRTITAIYPNAAVIKKAAGTISRFLTNQNNNWKYLGVTALAALVQVDPKYALDYQLMVIDCLDDPDETLKRKTLDLLYKMTNPANVQVITERLLSYLQSSSNKFIKADLVAKLTHLAERFSPNNQWFIEIMNSVFEVGGDLVRREVAHNLMRLIAEGTEDDDIDTELRTNAVLSYINLLKKSSLPDIVIKIICWVIGEYAYVTEEIDVEDVLETITALMNNDYQDPRTRSWIINAITRLVAQLGYLPEFVHTQIALNLTSVDTDMQQRCSELLELSQNLTLMQEMLPLDSACEDLEVDSSLSFLDAFVSEALVNGAPPYKPPHMRNVTEKPITTSPTQSSMKFEPYALPVKPSSSRSYDSSKKISPQIERRDSPIETVTTKGQSTPFGSSSVTDITLKPNRTPTPDLYDGIKVKGARKWGKEGYKKTNPIPLQKSVSSEESLTVLGGMDITTAIEKNEEEIKPAAETNASSRVSTIEAKPRLTPEQTRKSEFASALFTGLSGPSKSIRTKPKTSVKEIEKKETIPLSHVVHHETGGDLLLDLQDIDFTNSNNQPTTAIEHQSPQIHNTTGGGGGLFDNLQMDIQETTSYIEDTNITTSPNPPQPASSTSTSNDLIGLFDTSILEGNIQGPGLVTLDSTPLIPSVSQQQNESFPPLAIMDAPISQSISFQLPSDITGNPVVPGWDKKELCRDEQMRITGSKLLKHNELIIILIMTNQKQSQVDGVCLTIITPSNVKLSSTDEEMTWKGDIGGFGNVGRVFNLIPTSPSITLSVKGELCYRNQRLFYDIIIVPSDLIRPLKMSTSEFGKKWGSFHNEKKTKIVIKSVKNPSDFMQMMSTQMNFHAIEIIGSEGICAGTYLPNSLCLVHGKISSQSLEVWIKTSSGLLTDALIKQFQSMQ